ncbi:hypothetical protein [Thermogymnomonas acidicola]|uniref:hypothetical protein n=1 Tax=Thermogymnomonas acidicola TaxID=399579 RepID=UPI0009467676|nr:hypothetical protein [Thermogymnomonas acidicola]
MVVLHPPTDLIAFIPQYIVASIAAYYILTYTMQRMGGTVLPGSGSRVRQALLRPLSCCMSL